MWAVHWPNKIFFRMIIDKYGPVSNRDTNITIWSFDVKRKSVKRGHLLNGWNRGKYRRNPVVAFIWSI